MRLLYNPFRKRKKTKGLWEKIHLLSNFTWSNKKAIEEMSENVDFHAMKIHDYEIRLNELTLSLESLLTRYALVIKPKKRGRPRKKKA